MSLVMIGSLVLASFTPAAAQNVQLPQQEPQAQSKPAARIATACPTDLFFSEYVEGSSNNKALEIYNGTDATVDLSQYRVNLYSNGSPTPSTNSTNLSGALAPGTIFVIANPAASAEILAVANMTSMVTNFNGNDALALLHNGVIIDVIGQIGYDPGTAWGSGMTSTLDHTLRRKSSVMQGDANGSDAFDPALEWDGYAKDNIEDLGAHTIDSCGGGSSFTIAKSAPASVEVSDVFT
ncbi:MAG TPA: lamin tail domain-containing protein, partial [Anaerolineae bacterium]|nr:lamin tail domain-containing protein [Anaerolineae bacterium]